MFVIQLFSKKTHIVKLRNTKNHTRSKGSEFRIYNKMFGMREALVRCLITFMATVKILISTISRSVTQHREFVYTNQGQLTCRIEVVINESSCLNCRMKETVVEA